MDTYILGKRIEVEGRGRWEIIENKGTFIKWLPCIKIKNITVLYYLHARYILSTVTQFHRKAKP